MQAVSPLFGGISHATHRIDLQASSGQVSVVLRRWVRPNTDPLYGVKHEAETLALLSQAEIRAPRLIGFDADAVVSDVPAVIETLIEGDKPDLHILPRADFASKLADAIADVHAIGDRGRSIGVPFRGYFWDHKLEPPIWTTRRRLWKKALEVFYSERPSCAHGFIHRDYHPDNTLWRGQHLSGIVDWERSSWGPIAVDIAHMRVNLARIGHFDTAERYAEAYRRRTARSLPDLPYWDVVDAVDTLPAWEPLNQQESVNLEAFVEDGMKRLEGVAG